MIRRLAPAALAALIVLAGAQACAPALQRGGVDAARMRDADRDTANWLSWGRTWDEQRYSPLKSINDGNVGGLGLAWYADLGTYRGVEGTPLVVDGVLYNTSAWNITSAYDAKSGSLLWTYDPKVAPEVGRRACCDIVSRGLAVWRGKVIIAALDGRLIALDARSGVPVWSVQTFQGNWPYTITGAPRVFDGRVLIGNGGAELGVRGYVTAYDAETGRQLWRFYTVPGDPAKGFENQAMEMAAKSWHGEWWRAGGGGTVWDAMAYDPKLKLIYIGVGNGSPWAQKHRSPGGGDNLFLASIVALNADTGGYVWHYQETPGEQFDSTATQQMVLADLAIGGRTRQVIMQAPKNGFFYVLDRRTGELLSADAFMQTTWATHVDMKTGRPVETPAARYGEKPVLLAPHAGGGHNFNPVSYSPATGLVYFSVVQSYGIFAAAPSYTPGRGTGESFSGYEEERKQLQEFAEANTTAWLAAWDPVRRREAWRVAYPRDGSGGVLATAGNLVFQGTINRSFAAYRADNGARLWEMPVQNVAIAGPITYSVDGEQYIAVNAGWGGGLAHFERASGHGMNVSTARLLVFKLGGTAQLPPLPDAPPLEEPPRSVAPEATIQAGAALYAQHCVLCHGAQVRGGIRDLRRMTAATHREFDDILLRGTRARAGMATFADLLSPQDVAAIHAYVIARAHEDWGMTR
jgi:quinohemoprotein ethanol dehydrogenase